MRANRIVSFFLVFAIVVIWALPLAYGAPVLIKLRLADEAGFEAASRLNVAAYHRMAGEFAGEELVIAEFEKSSLSALGDAGLTYQIVDEEPWTENYYLISESPAAEKIDLTEYGRVLVSAEKSHFMKISDENARSVAARGYYIAKVFKRPLPLKYKAAGDPSPKGQIYDPDVDFYLSQIDQDSLFEWTLRLQNFQTRYTYTDSVLRARDWLFDKFASFGIDSLWLHHYIDDVHQWNVVATVVGTARPDKVIVVGGHYDSVVYGTGTDPYVWAPGADDNGTGTVATLEMARIVQENPLPVTVMFVPFAQEEQGLIGSWYFAEWLYYHYINVHWMINADMIAHSVDSYQDVTIYAHSSASYFVNLLMEMANTYTYMSPVYGGQSSGSDHYSFYQWGHDAVFAAEGDFFYGGWHKNYDTIDSLDFGYMKEVVKMCLAGLVTEAYNVGYVVGDPTRDGIIDIADVLFLINYLYKGGEAPDPTETGDVTCDGITNIDDVVFLINYLYKNGPAPPDSC